MMNYAYLILGGNIGDREDNLLKAIDLLQSNAGSVSLYSKIYETAAWGNTDQPSFLNQVVLLKTSMLSNNLMELILLIEKQMGRIRSFKNASRIIDIDILFYNNEIISTRQLTIPHPEIANRKFVLVPLAEVAPLFVHPFLQQTITTLLNDCKDPLQVNLYAGNSTIHKL